MNRSTKQASLLMHILERSYFGISIDFDENENGFNRCLRKDYNDPFDITVSLVDGTIEKATVLQVSNLMPDLNQELVGKLVEGINELIEYLKYPVNDYDSIIVPPKIKEKLSHTICSAIAISSSITTLVDSYDNNGFVSNLIKALFNFFS